MAKKNKRALIIVASAVLLITVITVAYAYFVATVQTVNEQTVVAETGTMRLVMNDGNAGWSEVWDFGESKSKTFTLQNTGSLPVTVDLYWKNLVNTFTSGSMVYNLKQTTDDATPVETYLVGSASTFENIPTSSSAISTNKLAENIEVPANKTYTYTLTIKLVDSEATDQTSDLNANFYTEFDIKEYEPPIVRCIDSNGDDMTCPSSLEVGQRIAVGDEVFRFIRYTSTSGNLNECDSACTLENCTITTCGDSTVGDIKAIAEYNLYVGYIHMYDGSNTRNEKISKELYPEIYGKQNNLARGFTIDSIGTTYYGTLEFSSDEVHGTNYSSYSGSIIKSYVNNYVQFLRSTYKLNVTGDLISKGELENIECSSENNSCSPTMYWIYNTSFWTKSPSNSHDVWYISSNNYFGKHGFFSAKDSFGVRPVITIPASYFN